MDSETDPHATEDAEALTAAAGYSRLQIVVAAADAGLKRAADDGLLKADDGLMKADECWVRADEGLMRADEGLMKAEEGWRRVWVDAHCRIVPASDLELAVEGEAAVEDETATEGEAAESVAKGDVEISDLNPGISGVEINSMCVIGSLPNGGEEPLLLLVLLPEWEKLELKVRDAKEAPKKRRPPARAHAFVHRPYRDGRSGLLPSPPARARMHMHAHACTCMHMHARTRHPSCDGREIACL